MGKRAKAKREKEELERKERKQYIENNFRVKNPWMYFWRRVDFWILAVCMIALAAYPFVPEKYKAKTEANMTTSGGAVITTSMGTIEIAFYKADAPKTVDNFEKLVKQNFYDGLTWHRVIKDFMIQTGDPNGDGTGGPGYQFDDEINSHKFVPGTIGMANSGPNTNGSQFFIVSNKDQPSLDGKYTVFAYVTKGMDVVQLISEAPTDEKDKPLSQITVESIRLK